MGGKPLQWEENKPCRFLLSGHCPGTRSGGHGGPPLQVGARADRLTNGVGATYGSSERVGATYVIGVRIG